MSDEHIHQWDSSSFGVVVVRWCRNPCGMSSIPLSDTLSGVVFCCLLLGFCFLFCFFVFLFCFVILFQFVFWLFFVIVIVYGFILIN